MVKHTSSKGKKRQTSYSSSLNSKSKATFVKSQPKRLRKSSRKVASTPVILSSDSSSEERNEGELNIIEDSESNVSGSEASDHDSHSTTPPPHIIHPNVDTSESASKTPIVSSVLSSTVSKWVSKTANNANDQGTRNLLSQLASVVPLGSASMARDTVFRNAQKEAIRGLRRPKEPDPSLSVSSVRKKRKGKAAASTFKVSSIIFLPHGTIKRPPRHALDIGDEVAEEDYIDTIAVTKAPDEAYIQILEKQQLAIRNVTEGYEVDTTWDYDDICTFLRGHFSFLFRYFEESPQADSYKSTTPFLVVHKSQRTLSAVPYDAASLDGGVLYRNSAVHKSGLHLWKLLFVTRHPIPLPIMTSWSRGKFIAVQPPPSARCGKSDHQNFKSQPGFKRKRESSPQSESDAEVGIIERSPVATRPRKRIAPSASADELNNSDNSVDDGTNPQALEIDTTTTTDHDDDLGWEDYDAMDFGPDMSAGSSATAGPSTAIPSNVTVMVETMDPESGHSDAETEKPQLGRYPSQELRFGEDDPLFSKTLRSSQQSFSNLNIQTREDPYSLGADFGFDF